MTALALLVACLQGPIVDAEAGFQGTAFSQTWTRISAVVIHDGESIDAELRITLRSASLESVVYRRPFPISRKTRMRVGVDVFLSGQETEADVELISKGKSLRKSVVQLNFVWGPEHRLLAVGPLPEVLGDGLGKDLKISVLRTTAELLPSSVLPLRALDTIVFPEPVELTTGQEDALRDWVEQGGRLVFFAGRSTLLRQHPMWREWCPLADPRVTAVPVPGKVPEESLTMVRGALRRGNLLQTLGAEPVAIRAAQGGGQVVFLSVMSDQTALRRLFPGKFLLPSLLDLPPPPKEEPNVRRRPVPGQPPPPGPKGLVVHEPEFLKRLLPWESPLRAASIGVGSGLGVLYVLLIGPLSYFRLRRKGRLRKGWIPFSALVLGFISAILVWGGVFSPRSSKLALLELWDESRVQTFAVLRPATGGVYEVDCRGTISPLGPSLPFGGREPLVPITVDLPTHVRLAAPPTASRILLADRPMEQGEPVLTATWKDRAKRLIEIHNPTPVVLRESWIVSKDEAWSVEAPLPGASRVVELRSGAPLTMWVERIGALEPSNNRWLHPNWDQVHLPYFGLAFSCFEAIHEARAADRNRHVLILRGLDRSPELARGELLFIGSFSQDVAGFRTEPPIPATIYGWARVRVREGGK